MQLIRHAPSLRQGCDIYRSAVGEVTDRRSVNRRAVCGRLAVGLVTGGRSVAGWRSVWLPAGGLRAVCGWPFHQLPVLHIGFLCQRRWRSVLSLAVGEDFGVRD